MAAPAVGQVLVYCDLWLCMILRRLPLVLCFRFHFTHRLPYESFPGDLFDDGDGDGDGESHRFGESRLAHYVNNHLNFHWRQGNQAGPLVLKFPNRTWINEE